MHREAFNMSMKQGREKTVIGVLCDVPTVYRARNAGPEFIGPWLVIFARPYFQMRLGTLFRKVHIAQESNST
jgi:hypothetical protein